MNMDQPPQNSPRPEKQYLYHGVPDNIAGTHLHPLNTMKNPEKLEIEEEIKEALKKVYEAEMGKYQSEYRRTIPNKEIPPLNCTWGDVLQFSPVHPALLKEALELQEFHPQEMKFYQIDPALLSSENTTIYLFNDDKNAPDKFAKLEEFSKLTQETKDHYRLAKEEGTKPFLFVGVPHVFLKGSLDVSNLPVIII
jgi:hypothetical protein